MEKIRHRDEELFYDAILTLDRDKEQLIQNLEKAPPADGTMAVLRLIHEVEKK